MSFATWWGGVNDTGAPPLIHGKLMELRRAVGGLEARPSKEAYGPKFPVKSSKELFQKLAQAVNDLGLLAYVAAQEVHHGEFVFTDKDGNEKSGTSVHVKSTVRVAAEDGSYVDFVGSGGGVDRDDKAGGKASTYAWKDAILKGLTVAEKELLDTDDEAGHGGSVKRSGKVTGSAAATDKVLDAWIGAVGKVKSAEELENLKVKALTSLKPETLTRLSPVWEERARLLKG